MAKKHDAIIIGGGIIGAATGYYLSSKGLRILLVEKDYLTAGSTGRCITGIRQQYSTPATIKIAMESVRIFRSMYKMLGMDVEWHASGYLFLAYSEDVAAMLKHNIQIQQKQGLDVRFIAARECGQLVPLMDTAGLIGGAWCASDGQASPFLTVRAFQNGIQKNGGEIRIHTPVTGILKEKNRVAGIRTATGDTHLAPVIINAAGPWAAEVSAMADIRLPVLPERHEALITEPVRYEGVPMLVDYRADGGYFVQRVTGQFIGCFTPQKPLQGKDISSSFTFLADMAARMVRLIPSLQDVAILRQWAGSYSMSPDGSPIIGETELKGFYCAAGMSGHGFMLGPAIGRLLAHYITEQHWLFNVDEILYGREFGGKEKLA